MNNEIEFLNEEMKKLPFKIETILDEVLPDTYALIGNYFNRYFDDMKFNPNIDSYDVRRIANHCFRQLNGAFFSNLQYFIYTKIRKLEEMLNNNQDMTKYLNNIEIELTTFIRSEFRNKAHKGIEMFNDEMNIQFFNRLNMPGGNEFRQKLMNKLEEYLNEACTQIEKYASVQINRISSEYHMIKTHSQEEPKKEINHKNEARLQKLYTENEEAIKNDVEVANAYNNLHRFYGEIGNRDDLSLVIDELELIQKFKAKVDKYEKTKSQEKVELNEYIEVPKEGNHHLDDIAEQIKKLGIKQTKDEDLVQDEINKFKMW